MMLKRLRLSPLLAIFTTLACGDDSGNSTPAAPFESQESDEQIASGLTPAEQTAFCDELLVYFKSEISDAQLVKVGCYFLAIAFTGDPTSDPPPVFLGLFADLDPLHAKYGDRGDRFALLEAGEILQQLSLAVAARGLAGYAVGGSIDDRLIALAGLQPVRARFVVGYAFGNPT